MSTHDDLRDILRAEAGRYDPDDDGWTGIQHGVRTARRRRRLQGSALGGLALVAVALGIGFTASGGRTDVDAGRDPSALASAPEPPEPTTSSTSSPTTSSTTSTSAPAAVEDPAFPGIWPFPTQAAVDAHDGDARFEDPVATASAFATDLAGMLDPVVGAVEQGGGVATVELRPRGEGGEPAPEGGPVTVVSLRSYPTDGARVWTVVGAGSPNIVVDQPASGAQVGAGSERVVRVRGRGTGYEGTVRAVVLQDGSGPADVLGEAVGIMGSWGEVGPLSLDVAFRAPTRPGGALLVTTDTGLDGVGVPELTAVRLHFDGAGTPPAPGPTPSDGPTDCAVAPPEGEPTADQMDVTVFFVCDAAVAAGDPLERAFVPVVRRTTREAAVLGATLRTFLAGTSVEEDDERGLSAFTSSAGTEVRVALAGGTAIVDFDGSLTSAATGASTSAGSELFRGALNRTVFQFSTVERIEYRLGGSCDAFWQWQQLGGCRVVTRADL